EYKRSGLQQHAINKDLCVSLAFVLNPSRTERKFPWFDHVNDWYAHKDEFDTLSLTYEDMIKDTRVALVKISNFLGKNLEEKTIDTIVDKSSFKNMKEDPQARSDIQHPAFFKQSGSLIRKVAQSEMFDKIYMEKMKDLPLEFDWEL
ncbi:unnamed protein product, partial [Coregonus sp. 'balchen']